LWLLSQRVEFINMSQLLVHSMICNKFEVSTTLDFVSIEGTGQTGRRTCCITSCGLGLPTVPYFPVLPLFRPLCPTSWLESSRDARCPVFWSVHTFCFQYVDSYWIPAQNKSVCPPQLIASCLRVAWRYATISCICLSSESDSICNQEIIWLLT